MAGAFFVPEWGWVGSGGVSVKNISTVYFSSPLGDGVVPLHSVFKTQFPKFSSPLGDGLVHEKNNNDNK